MRTYLFKVASGRCRDSGGYEISGSSLQFIHLYTASAFIREISRGRPGSNRYTTPPFATGANDLSSRNRSCVSSQHLRGTGTKVSMKSGSSLPGLYRRQQVRMNGARATQTDTGTQTGKPTAEVRLGHSFNSVIRWLPIPLTRYASAVTCRH